MVGVCALEDHGTNDSVFKIFLPSVGVLAFHLWMEINIFQMHRRSSKADSKGRP